MTDNPNPMNLLKKFEHQQVALEALRKENVLLRNKVVHLRVKISNLKDSLRKMIKSL